MKFIQLCQTKMPVDCRFVFIDQHLYMYRYHIDTLYIIIFSY